MALRMSHSSSHAEALRVSAAAAGGRHASARRSRLNAEIFTCLCTACNAIKFLSIRNSSSRTGSSKHDAADRFCNYRRIVVAGEGLCLSAAVASQVVCFLQPPQRIQEQLTASPCLQAPRSSFKSMIFPAWQLIPLWLAVLFNIVLRSLPTGETRISTKVKCDDDVGLVQRVATLENDLLNSVTVIRALTRQVEKLGVRVQVTRRTLQDPIQQAATLAGSMCEAVRALSSREALIEQELKETQKALMAIQDQQAKQLELIARLVKKSNEVKIPEVKIPEKKQKPNNQRPITVIDDDYKYDYWMASS